MKMNKTQINGTINISKKSRGTNSQPPDEWNKKNPATGYLEMREPNEKTKHFKWSNQISKLRFKIYYQKKKNKTFSDIELLRYFYLEVRKIVSTSFSPPSK